MEDHLDYADDSNEGSDELNPDNQNGKSKYSRNNAMQRTSVGNKRKGGSSGNNAQKKSKQRVRKRVMDSNCWWAYAPLTEENMKRHVLSH